MVAGRITIFSVMRRSGGPALLAVWAMLLQVVFSAEHLSAQAARALPGVNAEIAGFLSLCHGSSEGPSTPAEQGRAGSVACMLCASAALPAALAPPPVVAPGRTSIFRDIEWRLSSQWLAAHANYSSSARGPPSSFQS
jgi:hypothetical protein